MSNMNQERVLLRPVGWTMSAAAALSIFAGASFITGEAAAEDANAAFGGTSQHPSVAQISKNVSLSPIAASAVIHGAQYGTGGVALRNRGGGGIEISGVLAAVKAADLYWAVIVNGTIPPAVQSITLARVLPTVAAPVKLTGTLIGAGPSPCWGGTNILVYRASVPLTLANGNGFYSVTLNPGASGLTDGEDPWDGNIKFPLFEGASLVIVGTGTSTVAIFDKGLAGTTFAANPGISYTLNLPAAVKATPVLFDNIGADGQRGRSRLDISGDSSERTLLNGSAIAGPGSNANDSDWNGNSGLPLPQLWDDVGHDISTAAGPGTTQLNFNISVSSSMWDCLTPVANVVSFH